MSRFLNIFFVSREKGQQLVTVPGSLVDELLTHHYRDLEYSLNNPDEYGCTGVHYILQNRQLTDLHDSIYQIEGTKRLDTCHSTKLRFRPQIHQPRGD